MKKIDFIIKLNKYLFENDTTLEELSLSSGVSLDIIDNMLKDRLYVSFHDYRAISDIIGFDYAHNKYFIFEKDK